MILRSGKIGTIVAESAIAVHRELGPGLLPGCKPGHLLTRLFRIVQWVSRKCNLLKKTRCKSPKTLPHNHIQALVHQALTNGAFAVFVAFGTLPSRLKYQFESAILTTEGTESTEASLKGILFRRSSCARHC
jgi:hypothetical protein